LLREQAEELENGKQRGRSQQMNRLPSQMLNRTIECVAQVDAVQNCQNMKTVLMSGTHTHEWFASRSLLEPGSEIDL
jgi:hypothetical protein